MVKLSILVPTVPSRLTNFYPNLMTHLLQQTKDRSDVEILGLFDNKHRSVGHKRQALIDLAQGEYLTFIDDDDRIAPTYVQDILDTLYSNPQADCVVYDTVCCINGGPPTYCKYGIEFEYTTEGNQWRGKPAHTMVYKSELAKQHRYTDQNYGEDIDWVKRACQDIKSQVRIDKVLYYYDFNDKVTETRDQKSVPTLVSDLSQVVVVVANDHLKGINGEPVLWTYLCDNIDNLKGVDCTTVNTTHTNPNFHQLFKAYIDKSIPECKIIIQNATFMGLVDPTRYTVLYLQDNLRAMGRANPTQEHNLKSANLVVANSHYTASCYPEFDCKIIPIGTNGNIFYPQNKQELRQQYHLTKYSKIGIFVGAFNEVKGWSNVLNLITQRQDIFFILVTKYNDKPCGLPNTVTHSQIDQHTLSRLLNCADFFIVGSPIETQCLAAIEACFCDVPVIMNNTGIFKEFNVEDRDKVGYFSGDFVADIDKLYSQPHDWAPRQTMVKHGLSIQGMLDKWRELISTLR